MRWLLLALALGLGFLLWPVVPKIADRPIALPETPNLRITVLGTSLTGLYDWPDELPNRLAACGQLAEVSRIAQPGAGSDWGNLQSNAVLATMPDIVLMEFSINDADFRDGVSLRQSAQNHRDLIAALRKERPDLGIALMTMSPAQGPRGWIRPRLSRFYGLYAELAVELDLGLVDFYPRWLALNRHDRGLAKDGLHPENEVASAMVVPVLAAFLLPTCIPTNPAG